MTAKKTTIKAWRQQMARYESGPVVGEKYCCYSACALCRTCIAGCIPCPLCGMGALSGCIDFCSYKKLENAVRACSNSNNYLTIITPELTAAMKARHAFYKKYLSVLEGLPARRFTKSGFRGFPELKRED